MAWIIFTSPSSGKVSWKFRKRPLMFRKCTFNNLASASEIANDIKNLSAGILGAWSRGERHDARPREPGSSISQRRGMGWRVLLGLRPIDDAGIDRLAGSSDGLERELIAGNLDEHE